MKISAIMRKAIVIDDHIKVRDAAKIMSKKDIGSLIVVKGNSIKGIITERDIMRNLSKLDLQISKVMTKDVKTIDSEDDVENASNIMVAEKIKKLPVLGDKKLVGVITMTDLLAHSSKFSEFQEDFLIN
ncbi:MAG: CBS domain-containing protein [Nanoarchaeota archaeon]|nr:CBS domain-containing protein [Nanoarchaeota archaeon]